VLTLSERQEINIWMRTLGWESERALVDRRSNHTFRDWLLLLELTNYRRVLSKTTVTFALKACVESVNLYFSLAVSHIYRQYFSILAMNMYLMHGLQ